MKVSNIRDAEGALRRSLTALRQTLPPEDAANVGELLDAGEVGLALDTLCTQLYELDIAVSSDTLATFDAVGRSMGMEPELWTVLAVSDAGSPADD